MAAPCFKAGIDHLLERHPEWLATGRVALLSHQAALDAKGATSAQRLRQVLGKRLVALFGPEHGYGGQGGAGEAMRSCRHRDWGIPVYSLYGACRKPTPAMLAGIDLVVCDLQDLGARCYTYLATLHLMLTAAAEAGMRVIVADRPVPLPGVADGPVADPAFFSFVAPLALPMATGITPAEAALWICRTENLDVDLAVAPVAGWDRRGPRQPDWPDWMPPSPGIRSWESGMTYPATVFSEALPGIDCGRGTNLAFRLIGAPWMRGPVAAEALNSCGLPGVRFHPHAYVAGVTPHEGRQLEGVRLAVTDPLRFRPIATSLAILYTLARLHGRRRVWQHAGSRPEWFDKLYGTDTVRRALLDGERPERLAAAWAPSLQAYHRAVRSFSPYV